MLATVAIQAARNSRGGLDPPSSPAGGEAGGRLDVPSASGIMPSTSIRAFTDGGGLRLQMEGPTPRSRRSGCSNLPRILTVSQQLLSSPIRGEVVGSASILRRAVVIRAAASFDAVDDGRQRASLPFLS